MKDPVSLIVCGVGGQGILVASDVISIAALNAGFDVKKSEVHGMAQRGGAVVSAVRFGKKVYSPLVTDNEADYILAFEKLEALRSLPYLKKGGICIVNDYELPTLAITLGKETYPENIETQLREKAGKVYIIRALDEAKKLGNPRTLNIVMVGALAKLFDHEGYGFDESAWHNALTKRIKSKYIELNLKALRVGYELISL